MGSDAPSRRAMLPAVQTGRLGSEVYGLVEQWTTTSGAPRPSDTEQGNSTQRQAVPRNNINRSGVHLLEPELAQITSRCIMPVISATVLRQQFARQIDIPEIAWRCRIYNLYFQVIPECVRPRIAKKNLATHGELHLRNSGGSACASTKAGDVDIASNIRSKPDCCRIELIRQLSAINGNAAA